MGRLNASINDANNKSKSLHCILYKVPMHLSNFIEVPNKKKFLEFYDTDVSITTWYGQCIHKYIYDPFASHAVWCANFIAFYSCIQISNCHLHSTICYDKYYVIVNVFLQISSLPYNLHFMCVLIYDPKIPSINLVVEIVKLRENKDK
jgi:hypothetical protein